MSREAEHADGRRLPPEEEDGCECPEKYRNEAAAAGDADVSEAVGDADVSVEEAGDADESAAAGDADESAAATGDADEADS